jgi:hypothetical protein
MIKVVKKFNDDKYFYTKGVYMNMNMKEAHILRY